MRSKPQENKFSDGLNRPDLIGPVVRNHFTAYTMWKSFTLRSE